MGSTLLHCGSLAELAGRNGSREGQKPRPSFMPGGAGEKTLALSSGIYVYERVQPEEREMAGVGKGERQAKFNAVCYENVIVKPSGLCSK